MKNLPALTSFLKTYNDWDKWIMESCNVLEQVMRILLLMFLFRVGVSRVAKRAVPATQFWKQLAYCVGSISVFNVLSSACLCLAFWLSVNEQITDFCHLYIGEQPVKHCHLSQNSHLHPKYTIHISSDFTSLLFACVYISDTY